MFTTDEGVRMVATKGERDLAGSVTCSGRTTVAAELAPEALVGMVQRDGSSWLFVGVSGTLYETDGPLANFRRIIGAPTNFRRVVGHGKTILATTSTDALFRLNDDSVWRPVNITHARVYDMVVGDDGSALALAMPEKIYLSLDGQTFTEASAGATVGARRVGRTAQGMLGVQGVLGTIVWDRSKTPGLVRSRDPIATHGSQLALDPTILPTASAVVEGRAVLDGDRYVEVRLVDEESGSWGLATGPFTGPLSTTRLSDTNECAWMRVGARGRHIVTVCGRTDEDGNQLAVVRMSHDSGTKFGAPLQFASGDGDILHVAVASDGSALVTGLCKAKTGASGCSGSPPVLLRTEQDVVTSTLAATPPLMGLPISPAFSVDGKSAYFLARRAKDERLALFVSHDAGRTFAERSLDTHADRHTKDLDSEQARDGEPTEESFDPSDLTTIRPSDDGTIGMVLTTSRGSSYLTTDEDGHVLGMSQAPIDQALLAGYGRRVVAISTAAALDRGANIDVPINAWESSDGGALWNEVRVAQAVTREILTGPMTATCASAGCLIGTTVTRVGWEGQTDAPAVAKPRALELQKTRAARTPFVCTLDRKAPWKRIEHVWAGPASLSTIARGQSMWSVLSFDPSTNAISTTVALLPERGEGPAHITSRTMLGPTPKGAAYAVDISRQVEGYAAARVRIPDGGKPTGPMRNVEIGWENFFDGTSKQTTLPDAGMFGNGDIQRSDNRPYLETSFMSVSTGSIFINPHAPESLERRLYLLEARGKRSTPVFPEWPSLLEFGETTIHGDAAIVEGKPMAIGTVEKFENDSSSPVTMVLASPLENGLSKATAMSLFLPTLSDGSRVLAHDWTYRGATEVGVVGIESEPRAARARAVYLPYRALGGFGTPVEVPTPFDLPDLPRPCKAEERRTTPRVLAHGMSDMEFMFPGYRHPVLVTEDQKDKPTLGDNLTLLTWGVVLHGTKESPCVAGWEAYGMDPFGASAIISGDPSQAWLFRRVLESPPPTGLRIDEIMAARNDLLFEYRPMSCRFDSSASIPDAVWGQPGTFRWTAK